MTSKVDITEEAAPARHSGASRPVISSKGGGDRPARVLILAHKRPCFNSRLRNQSGTLARAGFDVLVVGLAGPSGPEEHVRDQVRLRQIRPVAFHHRLLFRHNHALRDGGKGRPWLFRIYRLLESCGSFWRLLAFNREAVRSIENEEPYDLVIANNVDTLPAALKLARRWRCRVLYDICELSYGRSSVPALTRQIISPLMETFLGRRASGVMTADPFYGRFLRRRFGIQPAAVFLSLPRRQGGAPGASLRERLCIPASAPILAASGGIAPNRGLASAIRALKFMRSPAHLVIQGEGSHESLLRALTAELGLRERVHFFPNVDDGNLAALLSGCDIGLSLHEPVDLQLKYCVANRLFHYVHAGVPILASDLPFNRLFVLRRGLGRLCDPGSPDAIASAADSMIHDPEAGAAIRGRMAALAPEWSWERQEDDFVSFIRGFAAAGKERHA